MCVWCLRTTNNNRPIINLYPKMFYLHRGMDCLVTTDACIVMHDNKYFTFIWGKYSTSLHNPKILNLVIVDSSTLTSRSVFGMIRTLSPKMPPIAPWSSRKKRCLPCQLETRWFMVTTSGRLVAYLAIRLPCLMATAVERTGKISPGTTCCFVWLMRQVTTESTSSSS